MRILFDSQLQSFKNPFGTLTPGQTCTLHMDIPSSVRAIRVECVISGEGVPGQTALLTLQESKGAYDRFGGSFSLQQPGLYFYYFYIVTENGGFRLFKQGSDTNMEAGDLWQVSCIPTNFTTPDWAKGAIIYQVFPDRFHRAGNCDLTGKLEPYTLHNQWDEEVAWQPTADGKVLNNDFFGGNFKGITEKLDYIASLGATVLYLNPISKSFSSHRYDTGDYMTPDPMLGTEADFTALCDAAHARGIKVILDGVYSHTGSNSLYFDKEGAFGGKGAWCSPDSPYYKWFTFYQYPHSYQAWWDFDTLPTVRKMEPDFIDYIITGQNSVVAHWLALGADGFRLDVADELPDAFIALLKQRIRECKPDALLMGEVWEDASNKIAYDVRRRYFTDGELDSVMNYPFRRCILDFLWDRDDGSGIRDAIMTIVENYPPQVLHCCMNLLGSHDTPRILTALVDDFEGSREQQAQRFLTPEQIRTAQERLKMASFLQYTLPGAPSIYYGDEAGMEGGKDPFNRRTYPWGKENPDLLAHYRRLGQLRKEQPCLQQGQIKFFHAQDYRLGFYRIHNGKRLRIYLNRNRDSWDIPTGKSLLQQGVHVTAPTWLSIEHGGFCILED